MEEGWRRQWEGLVDLPGQVLGHLDVAECRRDCFVALEGNSAIASLGTLYNEAIEDPHRESDLRCARGASDAGAIA
jgi:hypothetical protein